MAQSDLSATARAFLAAGFKVLTADRVLPTSAFDPHIRVGRDYFGDSIRELEEYAALEAHLDQAYPARFANPLKPDSEYASTYIFSLLEAAVALSWASQDYSTDSEAVTQAVNELVEVLDAETYEVVCCRAVSHLTTTGDDPVQIGDVSVTAEPNGSRSLIELIADEIPGSYSVFNREPPFAYDPPHSLLVVRETTAASDPFDKAARLSSKLERFLLHLRLLYAGTVQSLYEVQGVGTRVGRMSPLLMTFVSGPFPTRVRRTVRVSDSDEQPIGAVAELLAQADVKREGMAWTSFDVALSQFIESYGHYRPYDHLVGLATALEATLASGERDNEGLTLRLRSRAATLLATGNDPAQTIFSDVTQLYSLRSKLVHGGQIKQKELCKSIDRISTVPGDEANRMFGVALGRAVDRMRDLVRRAILARLGLAAAPTPLWPLPGAEVSVDAVLCDDDERAKWRAHWQDKLTELGAGAAVEQAPAAADYLSQDNR
ncbi:MAG: HEPN domain-containing protein [Chloroflexota bacterium]|nr:HEPN domain-containing protein [Chloroflexota bacterium]